jgi:hypothetical protein
MQSFLSFLSFRWMLTPRLIKIFFWLGIIVCIATAVRDMLGPEGIAWGVSVLLIGPILLRVFCEGLLVVFQINENLQEIRHQLTLKTDRE